MKFVKSYFDNLTFSMRNLSQEKILLSIKTLRKLRLRKGRLFIIGVGGSAGNAYMR